MTSDVVRPVTRPFTVELRELEPHTEPAEIPLNWGECSITVLRDRSVSCGYVAVLRDVTVLCPVLQPVHPKGRARWQLP